MKLVKTQPRYRCAYCTRVSTRIAMGRHEKICFRNPDRFCEACQNTGKIHVVGDGIEEPAYYEDCHFCRQMTPVESNSR